MVVDVHGEVDRLTVPELTRCLAEQLEQGPVALDVALTHTTFLDAAGIATLVDAARAASRRSIDFRVTGCPPRILRLFDLLGVTGELHASGHIPE